MWRGAPTARHWHTGTLIAHRSLPKRPLRRPPCAAQHLTSCRSLYLKQNHLIEIALERNLVELLVICEKKLVFPPYIWVKIDLSTKVLRSHIFLAFFFFSGVALKGYILIDFSIREGIPRMGATTIDHWQVNTLSLY